MHDIVRNIDSTQQTDLIILDFSKAFDTVPKNKLLFKLNKYGNNGNINKWIQSVLIHRKQQDIIGGKFSRQCPDDSGLPQCTELGSLLFYAT